MLNHRKNFAEPSRPLATSDTRHRLGLHIVYATVEAPHSALPCANQPRKDTLQVAGQCRVVIMIVILGSDVVTLPMQMSVQRVLSIEFTTLVSEAPISIFLCERDRRLHLITE
jgi:hypothetical protein